MLKVATNEEEITKVMKNLSKEEKIERLTNHFSDAEICEALGYYDGSNEDTEVLNELEEGTKEFQSSLYELAINNGNFEWAIAFNTYTSI
jgi:hypothetical protein